jgi:hypothetical protein
MGQDTSVDQNDSFWDENSQMWLRRSGVARWREVLAERTAERDANPEVFTELRERFGLPPQTA